LELGNLLLEVAGIFLKFGTIAVYVRFDNAHCVYIPLDDGVEMVSCVGLGLAINLIFGRIAPL
jgi:hypothetical protein